MAGFCVQITVKGRIGPSLRAAFATLDAEVVPRHNVVVVGSGEIPELVALLETLDQRGVEVERIDRPGKAASV